MYDRASPRYLTLTGHHLPGTPTTIEDRTAALAALHAEVAAAIAPTTHTKSNGTRSPHPGEPDDDVLLERARSAANGEKFRRLFDTGVTDGEDHSAADLALCGLLAFWAGRDAARMDRLFRRSALMRDKWNEKHAADGQTYGAMTVGKAVAACRKTYSGPATNGAASGNGHDQRSPWEAAQSIGDFLASEDDEDVQYLDPLHSLVPSALTEWFSPRGIGKTQVLHALLVRLAREGKRVLLLDRDNPRREIKRRLRGWGARDLDTAHFRVMTRDETPPLTDTAAWAQFPFDAFDLVALDSLDAHSEGVGEQDSARPSRSIAALLDLAHRANGPAVIVLGNTTKDGKAGRGSGVVEDRADIVFEIRDVTDFAPTGKKAWWEELPPAARGDWASRATRRKRRDTYRLAFIPTKHRGGPEPDPCIVELRLGGSPWSWRDVTADVEAAGEQAREAEAQEHRERLDAAATALVAEIERRAAAGLALPGKVEAEGLLMKAGLTSRAARALLTDRDGIAWTLAGPDRKTVLVTPISARGAPASASSANPHEQRGFAEVNSGTRMDTGRPHSTTKNVRDPEQDDTDTPSADSRARAREGTEVVL
jgi:hypothetical protein